MAACLALAIALLLFPFLAAFEAHVTNIEATIMNAVKVTAGSTVIRYGTVFPQEALVETFTVSLSDAFLAEDRLVGVEYRVSETTKTWEPASGEATPNAGTSYEGTYLDLRSYIDETKSAEETDTDTKDFASLDKTAGDISDAWEVPLHVPPIQGSAGQDYAGPVAPVEGDYGADVWIEVVSKTYANAGRLLSPPGLPVRFAEADGALRSPPELGPG